LIAESAAGQRPAGTEAVQTQALSLRGEGGSFPHQGKHGDLPAGVKAAQRLNHTEGNEILTVPVAQDQQTGGHAMADTIHSWEFAP
jgi:hypothetical protein